MWGHVTGGGGMWYGFRPIAWTVVCSRVWAHVAGCGGMWQGVGAYDKGFGHMAVGGVCGSGSDLWHKWGHVTGMGHVAGWGACGRVWCHVAGG